MPSLPQIEVQRCAAAEKRVDMSKAVSLRFAPSGNLFSRAMVVVDRLLMAHARGTIRNGDLPFFGL